MINDDQTDDEDKDEIDPIDCHKIYRIFHQIILKIIIRTSLMLSKFIKQLKRVNSPKKFSFLAKMSSHTTLKFFNSIRVFLKIPTDHIGFACKICKTSIKALIPYFNNLNDHLKHTTNGERTGSTFSTKSLKKLFGFIRRQYIRFNKIHYFIKFSSFAA